jgi:hypothetical protein
VRALQAIAATLLLFGLSTIGFACLYDSPGHNEGLLLGIMSLFGIVLCCFAVALISELEGAIPQARRWWSDPGIVLFGCLMIAAAAIVVLVARLLIVEAELLEKL